jgi:hypothetical protein
VNRKIACIKLSLILAALLSSNASEVLASGSTVTPAKIPDKAENRLDSLVVDINGERKKVDAGGSLDVVYGDLVTIVEATLLDKSAKVDVVDLVGFRGGNSKASGDDRGWVIDTGRHLSKKRSVAGDGRQYKIQVSRQGGISGEVVLNVLEPELISIELEVNGSVQKIQPGDVLRLSSKDMVRVVEIRTNVRGNENVKYDKTAKNGNKELRFSRGGRIFARIPIEWQMP